MQHPRHRGTIIANAGLKPNELSGFGCKGVGAEHKQLSYDKWNFGLIPHLGVVNVCKSNYLI